jgi:integrase/recombinase XerD
MGTPAKVLAPADVRRLEARVARGRFAARDRAIVMLSFKAGLRAAEIAGLDWSMVLSTDGRVAPCLLVADGIAKNGRGRRVPVHPDLGHALTRLHARLGQPSQGPVVRSERGGHMTPRGIVNWFAAHYRHLGLEGCSSHSGRRTFITRTARLIAKVGGSLKDAQELAGHRALSTTERYIAGDRDAQRRLVRLL